MLHYIFAQVSIHFLKNHPSLTLVVTLLIFFSPIILWVFQKLEEGGYHVQGSILGTRIRFTRDPGSIISFVQNSGDHFQMRRIRSQHPCIRPACHRRRHFVSPQWSWKGLPVTLRHSPMSFFIQTLRFCSNIFFWFLNCTIICLLPAWALCSSASVLLSISPGLRQDRVRMDHQHVTCLLLSVAT